MTQRKGPDLQAEDVLFLHRKSAEDDTEDEAPRSWGTRQEHERCRVLGRHVARHVARNGIVRGLRERLFGDPDATVPLERALELLASPATRYLGPDVFRRHGIAFVSHQAKLESRMPRLLKDAHIEDVRLKVWGPDFKPISLKRRVTISDARGVHRPPPVKLPTSRGVYDVALAHPGTRLSSIAGAAQQVAPSLLWSEVEAIVFLMTGMAPAVEPVSAELHEAMSEVTPLRPEIVLRVQPFVSMETLDRAMSACRLRLGRRLRLGPPIASRTLAVFDFVEEERARERWDKPPWTRLVRRWDLDDRTKRRRWGYGGDRGNFRRDYERARRLLIEEFEMPLRRAEKWAEEAARRS